jgi:hypothetical protein
MDKVEQRNLKRRHLIYYLDVIDCSSEEVIGQLVDITGGGLQIISTENYPAKENRKVRIVVEDDLKKLTHGNLEVEVVSCWSRRDVNPDYFACGFQFLDVTDLQHIAINHLIDAIGFNDVEPLEPSELGPVI